MAVAVLRTHATPFALHRRRGWLDFFPVAQLHAWPHSLPHSFAMNRIRKFLLILALACALPSFAFAQVDINHADAKTLAEALQGVGLVKAEAIVAYRDANGPFRKIEDLAKVKGIGAKTIEANRAAVVIVESKNAAQSGGDSARPLAVQ